MDRKPSEQPSAQPSLVRASLTAAATEPLQATLLRTVPIALIIGTVASLLLRGMPQGANDWRGWLSRVAAALWLTFGGHYIELLYLRGVLPRVIAEQGSENVSRWFVRLGARCAVWALGGAALWIGGVSTYLLIMDGRLPRAAELPAIVLQGALGFIIIELLGVHVALTILGRPSAWRRRDGRWG